jgi:hypothetical protein
MAAAKRADAVRPTSCDALTIPPSLRIRPVDLLVDRRDLSDPPPPLRMLHRDDLRLWPVEVIGDKGYLLVELVEGVA